MLAGRSARRDGGATEGAVLEQNIHLDGGIPARVEDLSGLDEFNGKRHGGDLESSGWETTEK
jgi:hypothetical protein